MLSTSKFCFIYPEIFFKKEKKIETFWKNFKVPNFLTVIEIKALRYTSWRLNILTNTSSFKRKIVIGRGEHLQARITYLSHVNWWNFNTSIRQLVTNFVNVYSPFFIAGFSDRSDNYLFRRCPSWTVAKRDKQNNRLPIKCYDRVARPLFTGAPFTYPKDILGKSCLRPLFTSVKSLVCCAFRIRT